MKFHNESQKTLVLRRLTHIEGRSGIAGMIEEERDCREICSSCRCEVSTPGNEPNPGRSPGPGGWCCDREKTRKLHETWLR